MIPPPRCLQPSFHVVHAVAQLDATVAARTPADEAWKLFGSCRFRKKMSRGGASSVRLLGLSVGVRWCHRGVVRHRHDKRRLPSVRGLPGTLTVPFVRAHEPITCLMRVSVCPIHRTRSSELGVTSERTTPASLSPPLLK